MLEYLCHPAGVNNSRFEERRHMAVTSAIGARHGAAGGRAQQARQALHLIFAVAPVLAGLDKFTHLLVNWDQYLAPAVASLLPVAPHTFMLAVGAIEIAAGLGVFFLPRVFAYVVSAWLVGIVLNLLLGGQYLDVALRDLGLAVGAFALGRQSEEAAER
jgi:hypothetical protein